jgi:hypothetical protein
MFIVARILRWIAYIAGLGAVTLGLTYWITGADIVMFHMTFGITLALTIITLSIITLFYKGLRVSGTVGILYALFIYALGRTQVFILTGDLHWLIRIVHLIFGLGAIAMANRMATTLEQRYRSLQPSVAPTGTGQEGRLYRIP